MAFEDMWFDRIMNPIVNPEGFGDALMPGAGGPGPIMPVQPAPVPPPTEALGFGPAMMGGGAMPMPGGPVPGSPDAAAYGAPAAPMPIAPGGGAAPSPIANNLISALKGVQKPMESKGPAIHQPAVPIAPRPQIGLQQILAMLAGQGRMGGR